MTTLILGSKGQLGVALVATRPVGQDIVGLDLPELDITNPEALRTICRKVQPDVIVNAAAYTAVDAAESDEAAAVAVNADGPANIAIAASETGARLIHISTDFVFDGSATTPYSPNMAPSPLSVYGRTKLAGEQAVLAALPDTGMVIRTAWLYSVTGNNFVKTMLRLMRERDELGVVADQRGTPTWANSLAETIWKAIEADNVAGTFHWTDFGEASWHEFAVAIQAEGLAAGLLDRLIPINPITSDQYPTPAHRPAYSVLDCSATEQALGVERRPWRDNLTAMLRELVVRENQKGSEPFS
jgi:dTDP-4-dehydrorhamnose reductase